MNLKGSYKALLNNSVAAMLAAIEIYNKPQIQYRDETFTILLINAWELATKAIISKNNQSIFYPKKRGEGYKTLSLKHALNKVRPLIPCNVQFEPLEQNIKAIEEYRDRAIHFYNQPSFSVFMYGLAQASIVNYKDLILSVFGINVATKMNLHLLPLAFGIPPEPIVFLQQSFDNLSKKRVVGEYISRISLINQELAENGFDTTRFLTVFNVSLQSVKKVASADIVVGIDNENQNIGASVIQKRVDPNHTHTLREMDALKEIGTDLHGMRFTTNTFRAIVWKYNLKENHIYCWRSQILGSSLYSREIISYIRNLDKHAIEQAREEYKTHMNRNRKASKKGIGVLR